MHPRQLLEENLALIDRLVARACRRVGVVAADDIADRASMVKVALVENDYSILRRYEGRSSLATYLAIVIQRLLADEHERTHGRWRPSAEAQRLGEQAVLIENLVTRQGRSIDEAMPAVRSSGSSMTREEVAAIASRLPRRMPRPREVALPPGESVPLAAADRADGRALDAELGALGHRTAEVLRDALAEWPANDRLLVRLRFESALTIADISRLLGVPQRPLYRRLEALLVQLREALRAAGIDPATADDLIAAADRIDIDFSAAWKNDQTSRTNELSARSNPEEHS